MERVSFQTDAASSFKSPQTREVFEYQVIGKEMYEHFGKHEARRIFPLFSSAKYTHRLIIDTWLEYQKQGLRKPFPYFIGMLNTRLKRENKLSP